MQNQKEKKKRNRGDNWTAEDKTLLQDLVRERVSAIENKNTDTNTNRSKHKAWQELHHSFNEISTSKRTLSQLKSQWCIAKMNAKKVKSTQRKEIERTGGGPPPDVEAESSEDISAWLPNEFVIDFNSFDSDKNQQVVVQRMPTEKDPDLEAAEKIQNMAQDEATEKSQDVAQDEATEKSQDVAQDEATEKSQDVATEKSQNVAQDEAVEKNQGTESISEQNDKLSGKRAKKRKQKPAESDAAKAIMECNIKCAKELHAMKMKTEQMKQRNLEIEHTILKEQMKHYVNK